jgi:hypothetical protein
MRGALAITGLLIFYVIPLLLGWPNRAPIALGNPQTAFGGLSLIYFSVIVLIACRSKADDWLFRWIRNSRVAHQLAVLFLFFGATFIVVGFLPA